MILARVRIGHTHAHTYTYTQSPLFTEKFLEQCENRKLQFNILYTHAVNTVMPNKKSWAQNQKMFQKLFHFLKEINVHNPI